MPEKDIFYLDESGFDIDMQKQYGFAKIGERLLAEKSGNRKGKRISVIAARDYKHNLLHSFYFKDSANKDAFKTCLKKALLSNLPYSSYLIMDNASFHKGKDVEELIAKSKINLVYLPTYSPDLNLIEKKRSQLKSLYRNFSYHFEDKMKLLDMILTNKYAR